MSEPFNTKYCIKNIIKPYSDTSSRIGLCTCLVNTSVIEGMNSKENTEKYIANRLISTDDKPITSIVISKNDIATNNLEYSNFWSLPIIVKTKKTENITIFNINILPAAALEVDAY